MKKFYAFSKKSDDTTELLVYGDITSMRWDESDVTGFDFAKELMAVDTPKVVVRINSYGGEVSQGLGMYNLLKEFKGEVTTVCDGFACSSASVVFMAGAKRVMPKTSLLMIHNPWTIAAGNADEFRKMADDLEKITEPLIASYVDNTGQSRDEVIRMMNEETWLTADEALSLGFATEVTSEEPKASVESHIVFSLVEKLKNAQKVKPNNDTHEPVNPWEAYFGLK